VATSELANTLAINDLNNITNNDIQINHFCSTGRPDSVGKGIAMAINKK
jgi:hypothetical protein